MIRNNTRFRLRGFFQGSTSEGSDDRFRMSTVDLILAKYVPFLRVAYKADYLQWLSR